MHMHCLFLMYVMNGENQFKELDGNCTYLSEKKSGPMLIIIEFNYITSGGNEC